MPEVAEPDHIGLETVGRIDDVERRTGTVGNQA